jgi:hypothetical protein
MQTQKKRAFFFKKKEQKCSYDVNQGAYRGARGTSGHSGAAAVFALIR